MNECKEKEGEVLVASVANLLGVIGNTLEWREQRTRHTSRKTTLAKGRGYLREIVRCAAYSTGMIQDCGGPIWNSFGV